VKLFCMEKAAHAVAASGCGARSPKRHGVALPASGVSGKHAGINGGRRWRRCTFLLMPGVSQQPGALRHGLHAWHEKARNIANVLSVGG
jgi:hypothetical protein